MPESGNSTSESGSKNVLGFWILGLCNNFAYVVMLSAAEDILSVAKAESAKNGTSGDDKCLQLINHRYCTPLSTGAVLLANIIPSWLIKILAPFIMNGVPFSIRHWVIVLFQTASLLIVSNSNQIFVGLFGVVLASLGSGLGEVTYFSLTSYFPDYVIASWSSGTGAAGIFGALSYASFTDSRILGFSPRSTLLCMLAVPVLFLLSYHCLLSPPRTAQLTSLIVPVGVVYRRLPDDLNASADESNSELEDEVETLRTPRNFAEKMRIGKSLLKFMVPLSIVFFAEYFINQGLVELLVFDCSSSFNMSPVSQYRWYQVLYQVSVFVSRSSSQCISIPPVLLPLLPILQLLNAGFFFWDAISQLIPHIIIVFAIIFYEGLLGGAAYVNTFTAIHKAVTQEEKEFSLAFAAMSDCFGIVLAAILAIPTHNYICGLP